MVLGKHVGRGELLQVPEDAHFERDCGLLGQQSYGCQSLDELFCLFVVASDRAFELAEEEQRHLLQLLGQDVWLQNRQLCRLHCCRLWLDESKLLEVCPQPGQYLLA